MEKLKKGESAVLENGKKYLCFAQIDDGRLSYVYLMSQFKPIEVVFAKQFVNNDDLVLEIVDDKKEKEKLLNLLQEQENNN